MMIHIPFLLVLQLLKTVTFGRILFFIILQFSMSLLRTASGNLEHCLSQSKSLRWNTSETSDTVHRTGSVVRNQVDRRKESPVLSPSLTLVRDKLPRNNENPTNLILTK